MELSVLRAALHAGPQAYMAGAGSWPLSAASWDGHSPGATSSPPSWATCLLYFPLFMGEGKQSKPSRSETPPFCQPPLAAAVPHRGGLLGWVGSGAFSSFPLPHPSSAYRKTRRVPASSLAGLLGRSCAHEEAPLPARHLGTALSHTLHLHPRIGAPLPESKPLCHSHPLLRLWCRGWPPLREAMTRTWAFPAMGHLSVGCSQLTRGARRLPS